VKNIGQLMKQAQQMQTRMAEMQAKLADAKNKVEAYVASETQKMMGGLPMPPGMKLPF
jgi:DNA-binding protein YbaB